MRQISGFHYRPTIRILNTPSTRTWSFFVDFYSLPKYDEPTIAEGSFLADCTLEEPWNEMKKGTIFDVLEGNHKIGEGIVLETARDFDPTVLPS